MFNWSSFFSVFLMFAFLAGLVVAIGAFIAIPVFLCEVVSQKSRSDILAWTALVMGFILEVAILAGFASTAKADDLYVRYSVNAIGSPSDLKSISIGQVYDHHIFETKIEGGLMIDQRVPNGVTGFGLGSVGIAPSYGPLFLRFNQGFMLINNPDNVYLSGNFQFVEDMGLGFRGNNDTSLFFGYRHISNAGLSQPNRGKDMFGLEVRISN